MSRRGHQQPTSRLPADAMAIFPYLETSDLKPFGKKGGKISYINFQGKKMRIQMGTFDDPVSFPFGVSEPYTDDNQQSQNQYQAYQQNVQQMNYAQQPMPGQGWNTMGQQPQPGQVWNPMGQQQTSQPQTGKKTLRIQFNEDSAEYKMVDQFDKDVLQICSKNWPKWFNGLQKTVDQLTETYCRTLKLTDQEGKPVPPGVNSKLDVDSMEVRVYDGEDENDLDDKGNPKKIMYPGTIQDVTQKSGGRAVIEIMGIWFVGGKFGVCVRTKKINVFANMQDDEDDFAEDDNVELRARPADLVVKGNSSEPDDHDIPPFNSENGGSKKRTASQAGFVSEPPTKRSNVDPTQNTTGSIQPPTQQMIPNAAVSTQPGMILPGQTIMPPVQQ